MAFKRVTAKVNLDAIANNYHKIREKVPETGKIMGIIKADAYGHGALPIARELVALGIDMFGVATIQEGISLRKHGISIPILILGYTGEEDYANVISYHLIQTVYEIETAQKLNQLAKSMNQKATIHIKVDTGMGRLGFFCNEDGLQDVRQIAEMNYLEADGIFTHFSKADESDFKYTREQIRLFQDFLQKLEVKGIRFPNIHASNSAGILQYSEATFNIVRAGIVLYGCYPSESVPKLQLIPALSVCSRIIFIKEMEAGRQISYGGVYQTPKKMKVATVSIGYADGYSRLMSNQGRVLVHGEYASVIGRVCMDQLMIDVTDIPNIAVGDEVVLFGSQNEKEILIEEVAALSQTINYEVMCLIGKRVPREYYRQGHCQFEIDYFDILEEGLHIQDDK